MNYKKLIVDSGVRMLTGGYTLETWGNISVRDPETGLVYITPSGMDYSRLTEDDVVVTDLKGKIVDGKRVPSIEKPLHLGVYNARADVNAVIHTHSVYSTAFACIGEEIPLIIDEAAQALGDVCRCTKYELPGTSEIASACVDALGDKANSCLLRNHGAVCVGSDMNMAFKVVKVLEATARIYQLVRAMGMNCEPISANNVAAMQDFVKNVYGQH